MVPTSPCKRQIQQCHLSKPPEGTPANEARAATLDYENQLTEIEHAKLGALQDVVAGNRARKVGIYHRRMAGRQPFTIRFQATRGG